MPAVQRSFSLRVLKRLLVLIMVAVLLSTNLMIWHNWRIEHEVLHTQEKAWANEFNLDLKRAVQSESQGLNQTLLAISTQSALIQAMARNDTERLQANWTPLFEQLRTQYDVTHFYFIAPDHTCLLRLHLPEQRGDRIDHNTLLEAERTGQSAWGLEIGKTGVLTLHFVQPVFDGDRLLGFLELGKEVERILTQLRPSDEHTYRFAVLLDKAHLDRANWESGMQMLRRQADWDALPRSVVELLGPELTMETLKFLLARSDWDNTEVAADLDGRRWHLQLEPLHVSGGE